jgi:hypothetical protein
MGLVLQRIDIGQSRAPGDRANTHEASGHHLLENVRIAFMCVMVSAPVNLRHKCA